MNHAIPAQKNQIDVVLAELDAALERETSHIEEGPADIDPVPAAERDRIGRPQA